MRFLLASSQSIVSIGLREYLRTAFSAADTVEVVDFSQVLVELRGPISFDLLVLDLSLPGPMRDCDLSTAKIAAENCPIMVVSPGSRNDLRRAVDAGMDGLVPSSGDLETFGAAVRTVLSGGIYFFCRRSGAGIEKELQQADRPRPLNGHRGNVERLTRRQKDVLGLMSEGFSNRSIAMTLGLTVSTVKGHVSKILETLGAQNRTQATLILNRSRQQNTQH